MGTIALSLPQTGLPNSTEDVKVTNDLTLIQNVINGNLDASNLSTTSGIMKLGVTVPGSNYAANYGDLVNAAPGITVTLPTPRSNALVGVVAQGGTSGASPVTVAGTNIYGVGLTAASSFKLGTPIAAVVLQSDGTNWIIVSGQQDTGWVAPTLGTGVSGIVGAYPPGVRLRGDEVKLRGAVQCPAPGGGLVWLTVPSGLRPAATVQNTTGWDTIGATTNYTIPTSGALTISQTQGSTAQLYLDGINYALSA